MILPTKVVKPVDSLIVASSYIIECLSNQQRTIDSILFYVNETNQKKIDIEKLLLCLDFLFLINKIEIDNETGKVKLRQ